MPRKPAAHGPASTAARLVYTESDLSETGSELRERWAERALDAEAQDMVPGLWAMDWGSIMRAFKATENAMKALNAARYEDGDEPLTTEEEIEDFFETSEDWALAYMGSYQGFDIRVWSYAPWDGQLAFALARGEDSIAAVATDIS